MIFVLVTTRPAVQGNFAINVTVCKRDPVCFWDERGFVVLPVAYSYLKAAAALEHGTLLFKAVSCDVGVREQCLFPGMVQAEKHRSYDEGKS